jgi:hypothetical protein
MKVYVLIRQDIGSSHCAVQAGHALVELTQNFDLKDWIINHRTLVYLKVKSIEELMDYFDYCPTKEKAIFKEPDMGNECTAMATLARTKDEERFFKRLGLL